MIVIVCGGRNYSDSNSVFSALNALHTKKEIKTVFEGGQTGADTIARMWAHSSGIDCITVHANWKGRGKKAGPFRNAKMLHLARLLSAILEDEVGVVAFSGGAGTADMVKKSRDAQVTVWEPVK